MFISWDSVGRQIYQIKIFHTYVYYNTVNAPTCFILFLYLICLVYLIYLINYVASQLIKNFRKFL